MVIGKTGGFEIVSKPEAMRGLPKSESENFFTGGAPTRKLSFYVFRFARTPHPEKQHAMIADQRNPVVRPQPWWAVCYALGPVSAGLLPFGLYIYARRKRIPGLEFHALQSTFWNAVIAVTTCAIALAEPQGLFWLGIPVLNGAFHLWPVWLVSQRRFFTYPHGQREVLLRSVLWLRSLRKEGPQSDIEFSTAILDMQVPPSWARAYLHSLRGDVQAMMSDSRAALGLDPACWNARANLGLALLLNGQGDVARNEYEQAAAACKKAESLADVIEELQKALQARGPLAGSEAILAMLRARHAELARGLTD
jgi:tetratricopeptide (TPR) repeat protein